MTSNLTPGFGIGPAATPALVNRTHVTPSLRGNTTPLQEGGGLLCTRPVRQLHSFRNFHRRQTLVFFTHIFILLFVFCRKATAPLSETDKRALFMSRTNSRKLHARPFWCKAWHFSVWTGTHDSLRSHIRSDIANANVSVDSWCSAAKS